MLIIVHYCNNKLSRCDCSCEYDLNVLKNFFLGIGKEKVNGLQQNQKRKSQEAPVQPSKKKKGQPEEGKLQ